ncbi:hypothetical protein QEN19_001496 [Hanseniaspora menglaensis]
MFKLSASRQHCSNIFTPASAALPKKIKQCPLNKTARNLYVSYITLAITLPFTISYIYNYDHSKKSSVHDTLLIEDNEATSVRKRQHSVRYIF